MVDNTGARRQESLRSHPSMKGMREFPYPLKGIVDAVYYMDDPENITNQTLVDIVLMGGYSNLCNVPISSPKTNASEGTEWTPEPGDIVIVQFIGGRWTDPIVTGYCNLPDNEIQAKKADAPIDTRRYHMRCNETDIVIDKDGNRITTVAGDETHTVDGKRTTIIEGNDEITVNSGDVKITVAAGKCTVTIAGKTAWKSDGGIELDGGGGAVKGIVQGDCICAFTGAPHIMVSATVKGSK